MGLKAICMYGKESGAGNIGSQPDQNRLLLDL